MPAYARDGKVACFFEGAYATFGFSDRADLDEGPLWPTSYALTQPTSGTKAQIIERATC